MNDQADSFAVACKKHFGLEVARERGWLGSQQQYTVKIEEAWLPFLPEYLKQIRHTNQPKLSGSSGLYWDILTHMAERRERIEEYFRKTDSEIRESLDSLKCQHCLKLNTFLMV